MMTSVPIDDAGEHGDVRAVVVAVNTRYRRHGEARTMQELHGSMSIFKSDVGGSI